MQQCWSSLFQACCLRSLPFGCFLFLYKPVYPYFALITTLTQPPPTGPPQTTPPARHKLCYSAQSYTQHHTSVIYDVDSLQSSKYRREGKPLAKTYKAPAHQPALPNFQTLGMLGQMPMTVHPAAREKWTGYREDPNQSEIADHTTTVKFEPSSDSPVEKNGRFVSLWKEGSHLIDAQGRSVELATEDDEEDVSLPMSRIDLQDKTDITIPDAESTPKGKFDGMAIQDTYFDSDDSEYPDEEFQTATEGTSKPEAGCQLHCNNEILTRLRAAAPRTEFAYRNCALDEIERIFLLEQTKAERYAGYVVPPLVVIATDRAKFIIQCRNDDIERRGLDEYYVDAQIDWAKWTVKAVKAGLFHLPRGQCGSLRNQVQARDP